MEARSAEAKSLLTGAKSSEVFCRPWDNVGSKLHDNTTSWLTTNGNIEEYSWKGTHIQVIRRSKQYHLVRLRVVQNELIQGILSNSKLKLT